MKTFLLVTTLLGPSAALAAGNAVSPVLPPKEAPTVPQPTRGAVVDAALLSAEARAALEAEVAAARTRAPVSFQRFEQIRAKAPTLDARKRGRLAPMTPLLRAAGPELLLPMLEEIALRSPGKGEWTDTAWRAWRVSMLEAVGALRDPRARPVLEAIVRHGADDARVLRAGALALALYDDDRAATVLATEAGRVRPDRAAIVEAMGSCRRPAVVTALRSLLASAQDAALTRAALEALGRVGDAWAWKALPAERRADEQSIRRAAAEALVEAFVAHDGRLRDTAGKAVLAVAAPETPDLLQRARQASPAHAAEIDALANRFARLAGQ